VTIKILSAKLSKKSCVKTVFEFVLDIAKMPFGKEWNASNKGFKLENKKGM